MLALVASIHASRGGCFNTETRRAWRRIKSFDRKAWILATSARMTTERTKRMVL